MIATRCITTCKQPRTRYSSTGAPSRTSFGRKIGQVLRWASGNGFVFAKIVHHPGYKGDPYLTRARDAIAARFTTIAREAWANIIRRLRS